ncbi:hypothetical protein [Streptomyces sp. E-08]|uniref:hypothetical protein n=1 Tax=Streptomyces sp. E-08 TaxID=3404047 RepID=UPI003CEB7D31
MGLVERAWPGIKERTDRAAEAACELANAAAEYGWSAASTDNTLTAIDILAAKVALGAREVLATVMAATARRRVGLPVDPEADSDSWTASTVPGVPGPCTGGRP